MPAAYVIGLGRSGIAAARVLVRVGQPVVLLDRNDTPALQAKQQQLAAEGIEVRLGAELPLEPPPALVVVSPGVPWDLPVLERARAAGIDTIGEVELAWRHLRDLPWVGITGTNGKTTTTALVAAMFAAAGVKAPACGNIGNATCEVALQALSGDRPEWIPAEISSYQIESSREIAPRVGIWTTFSPDHLERHYTIANYFAIKRALLARSDTPVFNGDDPELRARLASWPGALWTSAAGKDALPAGVEAGAWVESGWVVAFGERVLPLSRFSMVGAHNVQNLLLAVAAARLAGIEAEAIARAIAHFGGVPHRLERVRTFASGLEFINDSKATNYDAAEVGLRSVAAPTVLIAGGRAKSGDDTRWLQALRDRAAAVLLVGEAAAAFRTRLQESGIEGIVVETLERAVPEARALAIARGAKTVLLSPACASFDQYTSFEARGDRFRELVAQLPERSGQSV